jgi:cell division protein FtsI/penicillin-binding protein 2
MQLSFITRLRILKFFFIGIFIIFCIKLFNLQILDYEKYAEAARLQHEKKSILPARRGKILVRKNYRVDEVTPLATNNTLKRIYLDPLVLNYPKYNPKLPLNSQERGNPELAARILAPILIHAHCEKVEGCEIETNLSELSKEEQMAISIYQQELTKIFTQIERTRVLIATDISKSRIDSINALNITGLWTEGKSVLVDPTKIYSVDLVAEKISPILNIEVLKLKKYISRRPKRYVDLMHKVVPEVSEKILELKKNPEYKSLLRGIQLRDEHWRYYPEKKLAAQVLGFVDSQGNGQYGLESRFNYELKGKDGHVNGATNTRGQRILGSTSNIDRARDGADLLITIDRVIQDRVSRILEEDVKRYEADFGQIVIIEPTTGKILAMVHAPSFDPNEYGKSFASYEITPEQEQLDREDENFNQRIPTIVDKSRYYRYFNKWGPSVFRNKIVADLYEPGSVMKAITMAIALQAGEVTPQTTYDDNGPVVVGEFKIRNSDEIYAGPTSMISVLNRSLNTGIAFITRKMGIKMLYENLRNFGFGQYSDIELDGELQGVLENWKHWSESELITRGFGQGISVTPLQMALAFSALANGGYLMKPILVEEIRYSDGQVKKFYPEKIRRVISDKTYNTIKSMLQNSVSHGVARGARVKGYSVMGKTGTSQTYKNGKALEGLGTTITSFAGFAPFDNPRFVILVKFDYPKTSQWGSETAAPTFRKVAKFLFDYYEIPPDK